MAATDSKVQGQWRARARAVEKQGQPLACLLPPHRAPEAARHLLQKAIRCNGLPATRTIDGSAAHEAARQSDNEAHGTAILIRPVQDFNHIVAQAHQAGQRVTRPMVGGQSVRGSPGHPGGDRAPA